MSLRIRLTLASGLCVLAFAAPSSTAPAQTTGYSQRLAALQQQNALQQQQSAVQNAVQQTTILTQTVYRQNGVPLQTVTALPIKFQQQQSALRTAMQQTNALLQTSQQRNAALSRTALGQLNALQGVLQQSVSIQNSLQRQGNLLTPVQLLLLAQAQPNLSRLLVTLPVSLPTSTPGRGGHRR